MFFKIGAFILTLIILIPILSIFVELFHILYLSFFDTNSTAFTELKANLSHFFSYLFLKFIKSTFIVCFFTLLCSVILGSSLAYLIARFNFFGRAFLEKILILPLAIPAYILAFVYVGIMEFDGFFNAFFGFRIDFFNIYGLIFILSISLYPYVYMFAKTSFQSEAIALYEAASLMGRSGFNIFFSLGLIMARPAILAGGILILMEVLSDYGASAYLGIDTFSAGIFKLWYDLNDLYSASILTGFLLIFVIFLIFVEKFYKDKRSYSLAQDTSLLIVRKDLGKIPAFFASLYAFIIAFLGFIIPFCWLGFWALQDSKLFEAEFYTMIFNSFSLAFVAALITTLCACFLCFVARIHRYAFFSALVLKLSSIGYALPGAALGVSVMIVCVFFGQMSGIFLLGTSLSVLIFAYLIRFLAPSIYSLENAYDKIHLNFDEAAMQLRKNRFILFFKIHLPLLKTFLALSFMMVFIDVVKELPLTRILVPFNYETLSVKAFWYASDERIYDAALPSFVIVLLSFIALLILQFFMRNNDVRNQKSKQKL